MTAHRDSVSYVYGPLVHLLLPPEGPKRPSLVELPPT